MKPPILKENGPPPAQGFPRLKSKVYRLLVSGVRVQIDIELQLGAQLDIAGHVDITAKSRGCQTPEEATTDQGEPDSFGSCGVPHAEAVGGG